MTPRCRTSRLIGAGVLIVALAAAAAVALRWQSGSERTQGPAGGRPATGFDRLVSDARCGTHAAYRTGEKRQRPPDAPASEFTEDYTPSAMQLFNNYGRPESVYATGDAVVHYVTNGVNAPPLNDDDENGVPDYVQRAAGAAEQAIHHFRTRGFAAIRADTGGPSPLPDIYISRFTAGYFGVALPATRAEGGPFVVVANWLDPSPTRSLGSLYGTVSHELFHLVQFSYFPPDADLVLPQWVQEGMAGGIESSVHPDLQDILWDIQAREWLESPSRSITTSPYAAELFWRYADERAPRLLPTFLATVAKRKTSALSALQTVCGRVGLQSVARLFHEFAVSAFDEHGDDLGPTGWVAARRASVTVRPLALQYLRLPFPAGRGYVLTVTLSAPSDGRYVTLVSRAPPTTPGDWPETVKVRPSAHASRVLTWRLRPARNRAEPSLLLSASCVSHATTFGLQVARLDGSR